MRRFAWSAAGVGALAALAIGATLRPPDASARLDASPGISEGSIVSSVSGSAAVRPDEGLPGLSLLPPEARLRDDAGGPELWTPTRPVPGLGAGPVQASDLREFYFTRMAYSGGGGGYGWRRRQSWATDYPKSDRQFLTVVERLTNLHLFMEEHPILLTDENLRRFPFLYAVEVGYMSMTEPEVRALRDFLLGGGFLVVDDFWGTYEWQNLEYEMQKVFPEFPIVDLPLDHDVFHTFYDIEEILQVPALGRGINGAPTFERDGYDPVARGIFDDDGRLMVVINWNTDLGDAWEWAENPYYPLKFSTFAYQMGVNFIVYAMSH